MAALNIRNIDETVKRRLQSARLVTADQWRQRHARSSRKPFASPRTRSGCSRRWLDRFGTVGGVDLDLPARDEPARAADFST